jgi:Cu/Ag efflux protein CusF
MKLSILVIAFLLFFGCGKNRQTPNISTNTVEKQTYKSVGIIKNADTENGKLTIDHEDIKGYMSAMEMNESVSDKVMLHLVKIGDKVEFEIERTGERIVITKLNKIGEVTAINGTEIYKTNCASCHGTNGEGSKKGIPLTSGHALHHSETEHIKQVTDGEGKKMPAFKDKLSTDQITEVVKFVRNEIQKDSVREDSHSHSH